MKRRKAAWNWNETIVLCVLYIFNINSYTLSIFCKKKRKATIILPMLSMDTLSAGFTE